MHFLPLTPHVSYRRSKEELETLYVHGLAVPALSAPLYNTPVFRTACFSSCILLLPWFLVLNGCSNVRSLPPARLWELVTHWCTSPSSSLGSLVDCKLFSARNSSRPLLSLWSPVGKTILYLIIVFSLLVFLSFAVVGIMLFQLCWTRERAVEKRNLLDRGFKYTQAARVNGCHSIWVSEISLNFQIFLSIEIFWTSYLHLNKSKIQALSVTLKLAL